MVEEAKTAETGLSASSRGCNSTAAKVTLFHHQHREDGGRGSRMTPHRAQIPPFSAETHGKHQAAAPHCLFMLDSFRQARARCPEGNAAQRLRNWERLRSSIQRRRRGLSADCQAPVQNWTVCFVSAACCLLASAKATLRARPAAAFAALNHMLISGFFFNQGFAIDLLPSMGRARGLHWTSRT